MNRPAIPWRAPEDGGVEPFFPLPHPSLAVGQSGISELNSGRQVQISLGYPKARRARSRPRKTASATRGTTRFLNLGRYHPVIVQRQPLPQIASWIFSKT